MNSEIWKEIKHLIKTNAKFTNFRSMFHRKKFAGWRKKVKHFLSLLPKKQKMSIFFTTLPWRFVYFINLVFVQFVFEGVDRLCFTILLESVLIRDTFLAYCLYILFLCTPVCWDVIYYACVPGVLRCDILCLCARCAEMWYIMLVCPGVLRCDILCLCTPVCWDVIYYACVPRCAGMWYIKITYRYTT